MTILVSSEEHERLLQAQAYLEMLRLARLLEDRGVTASSCSVHRERNWKPGNTVRDHAEWVQWIGDCEKTE